MTPKQIRPSLLPREAFLLYGFLGLHRVKVYDFLRALTHLSPKEVRAMIAVRDTLKTLLAMGEKECIEAVEEIYFSMKMTTPKAKEISARVERFSSVKYLDSRTVYRRLERAGKIYNSHLESSQEYCA